MPDERNRMTGDDITELRYILGLKTIDMRWLFGTPGEIKSARTDGPVKDVTTSILARYLYKYPDEAPMLKMPQFPELFDTLKEVKQNMSLRAASFMCGLSGWSGHRWYKGGPTTPLVERLFYILMQAVQNEGLEGFRKFMEVVDEEARSRGFVQGLTSVMRNNSWNKEKQKELDEAQKAEE